MKSMFLILIKGISIFMDINRNTLVLLLFLFLPFKLFAIHIMGNGASQITEKNSTIETVFLYKDIPIITIRPSLNKNDTVIANNYDDHLSNIMFPCKAGATEICSIFFKSAPFEKSDIIKNLAAVNSKKEIMLINNISLELKPIFIKCKNPYHLNIQPKTGTILGLQTKFIANDKIFIEYTDFDGKLRAKTIEINYQKLYTDCKS